VKIRAFPSKLKDAINFFVTSINNKFLTDKSSSCFSPKKSHNKIDFLEFHPNSWQIFFSFLSPSPKIRRHQTHVQACTKNFPFVYSRIKNYLDRRSKRQSKQGKFILLISREN
jgi:hypothetical protein